MKRLWFAVIFLTAAACACIYEQYTVKTAYKKITAVIDEAVSAENENVKIKYCDEITKKWEKSYKTISLVSDHSVFQNADISFGMISALAEEGSDSINDTLIQAKSELSQIYDSSKINLSNIF